MDHFLYQFSTFSEKNEENLLIRSLNFLQNAQSNSVLFSSSFICAVVSNVSVDSSLIFNAENPGDHVKLFRRKKRYS